MLGEIESGPIFFQLSGNVLYFAGAMFQIAMVLFSISFFFLLNYNDGLYCRHHQVIWKRSTMCFAVALDSVIHFYFAILPHEHPIV